MRRYLDVSKRAFRGSPLFHLPFAAIAILLWSMSAAPLVLLAQTGFTRIYGSQDTDVPIPQLVLPLGRQDAGALQELAAYRKAANITSWNGMQASGTFTNSAGVSNPARLTILNGDHFRLDVQMEKGTRSTRISGNSGKTTEIGGKSYGLPSLTARTGLLAFPKLLLSGFPSANISLIDRGQVRIGGQACHAITAEEAASLDDSVKSSREIAVTDLYFDSSSHLLVESASTVQVDSRDRELYLMVTKYGDYQRIGESLIPLTYSQTLNGQPQWTLQVNSPDLQPSIDETYFRF